MWTLLLLAAMVRSFAHMPLGISDRNSIIVTKYIYNTAEMPNNKWRFLFFAEQFYTEIYFICFIVRLYKNTNMG